MTPSGREVRKPAGGCRTSGLWEFFLRILFCRTDDTGNDGRRFFSDVIGEANGSVPASFVSIPVERPTSSLVASCLIVPRMLYPPPPPSGATRDDVGRSTG